MSAPTLLSSPFFLLQMTFQLVSRWKSYTFPKLPASIPDLINLILEQLEVRHGYKLTSHILSLITCSKYGLSESELEDILSLDDEVITLELSSLTHFYMRCRVGGVVILSVCH